MPNTQVQTFTYTVRLGRWNNHRTNEFARSIAADRCRRLRAFCHLADRLADCLVARSLAGSALWTVVKVASDPVGDATMGRSRQQSFPRLFQLFRRLLFLSLQDRMNRTTMSIDKAAAVARSNSDSTLIRCSRNGCDVVAAASAFCVAHHHFTCSSAEPRNEPYSSGRLNVLTLIPWHRHDRPELFWLFSTIHCSPFGGIELADLDETYSTLSDAEHVSTEAANP